MMFYIKKHKALFVIAIGILIAIVMVCLICSNHRISKPTELKSGGKIDASTESVGDTDGDESVLSDDTDSVENNSTSAAAEKGEKAPRQSILTTSEETSSTVKEEDAGSKSNDKTDGTSPENAQSGEEVKKLPQKLKYEEFCALSGPEKDAYKNSFPSRADFYDWVVEAQEKFKQDYPEAIILGDGSIDLGKYQ